MGSKKKEVMAPEAAGRNEMTALFPEIPVGPYKVKPWSFGKFIECYPSLMKGILALRGAGIDPEKLKDSLLEKGPEIIGLMLPNLPPLIAATLGVPQAEVEEMDLGLAAAVGLTIIQQNLARIKNYLPLIMSNSQAIIRAA